MIETPTEPEPTDGCRHVSENSPSRIDGWQPRAERGAAGFGPRARQLQETQARVHPACVACGQNNDRGLALRFCLLDDGGVEAVFPGGQAFEGYAGIVHGGVVASLLDSAMTNCLFAHELVAVTAELKVRFRHPVTTTAPATLRAWLRESYGVLHLVDAELRQDVRVKVRASGKFVERSSIAGDGDERTQPAQ